MNTTPARLKTVSYGHVPAVTGGSDSIPGLPGWPARPGYDLPAGVGTAAAALPLVTALARAAS